jgi:chromosome segregation ATPase
MGKLITNLTLQHSRLEDIEDRLDEIDAEHKRAIDEAIDDLEERISEAQDALEEKDREDEEDEDEEDEADESELDFE